MPIYYDDEEDVGYPERDTGQDYVPALPQPSASPEFAVPISGPGAPLGASDREYYSGNPGLFIQGGPSVPAGTIRVNGQLERSQAAPQPIPWWITAADDFREQRRQEDFLRSALANQTSTDGTAAIDRAMQLEGILGFDSDRRAGVPVQEALMRHAPKMYFKSPASVSRLETGLARARPVTQPFVPTVTDVGGQQLFQISPQRFSFGPRKPTDKPTGLSPEGRLKALSTQLRDVQKQEEAASFSRDKTAMSKLANQRQKIVGEIEKLTGGEQPATAPAAQASNPKTVAANQLGAKLRAEHPEWSVDKLKQEVRKQLK